MKLFRHRPSSGRIPLLQKILITVGAVTLIYLFITYALIPLLALMTAR